jgi:ipoprotein LpqH
MTAGIALTIGGLAGCAPARPPSPPAAAVTIDGRSALQTQSVTCNQQQWTWMVAVGDTASGAEFTVDTSKDKPAAVSVHINNVGGFSGIYSQGNGDADTRVSGEIFTIAGTANGIHTDTQEPASAQYKIVARC